MPTRATATLLVACLGLVATAAHAKRGNPRPLPPAYTVTRVGTWMGIGGFAGTLAFGIAASSTSDPTAQSAHLAVRSLVAWPALYVGTGMLAGGSLATGLDIRQDRRRHPLTAGIFAVSGAGIFALAKATDLGLRVSQGGSYAGDRAMSSLIGLSVALSFTTGLGQHRWNQNALRRQRRLPIASAQLRPRPDGVDLVVRW